MHRTQEHLSEGRPETSIQRTNSILIVQTFNKLEVGCSHFLCLNLRSAFEQFQRSSHEYAAADRQFVKNNLTIHRNCLICKSFSFLRAKLPVQVFFLRTLWQQRDYKFVSRLINYIEYQAAPTLILEREPLKNPLTPSPLQVLLKVDNIVGYNVRSTCIRIYSLLSVYVLTLTVSRG